jgi:hypothetical protein
MKSSTKKLLLISFFAGLVIIFILVGKTDIYFKNGGLHRSDLKARLQKMEMQYEAELTKDFSSNEIQNLKIIVDSESVKLCSGDRFSVYICHMIHLDQQPVVHLKNKTLTLKAFAQKEDYLAFRPKMEVIIPADAKLKSLSITNKNGKTKIDNLQTKTTKLELGEGNFTCEKFTSQTMKIKAQNEDIKFYQVNLKNLNLKNQKGDLDLVKLTTIKPSIIKNGTGDITLTNATTPGLDINTAIGKVQIYGKNQKQTRYKAGNKKRMLKVQTNSGDIKVG